LRRQRKSAKNLFRQISNPEPAPSAGDSAAPHLRLVAEHSVGLEQALVSSRANSHWPSAESLTDMQVMKDDHLSDRESLGRISN
jgi:hypothetical protein